MMSSPELHLSAMNFAGIPSELLPEVCEQLPHLVWLATKDGSITYVNRYGLDYLGVTMEQLAGWSWMQIIHPADREPTIHAWIEATASGSKLDTKYRMITACGLFRWNLVRARPVRDQSGDIFLYIGTCTDVDDWKQSLRDLSSANREIEQLLALLNVYESKAPIGMGFVNHELRYMRLNGTLAEMNGRPVAAHLGRYMREVLPKLWPTLGPLFEKILSTHQPVINIEINGETEACSGKPRRWFANYYPVLHAGELFGVALLVVEVPNEQNIFHSLQNAEPEVEGHCLQPDNIVQSPPSAFAGNSSSAA